jgi:signal transduction histidine kinase
MNLRTARVIALTALGVTVLSIGFVTVGLIAPPTPTAGPHQIVVIGDASVPSMQAVYEELQAVAKTGKDFNANGETDLGVGLAFSLFIVLWAITGALIVFRQPSNFAGWAFLTIGTSLALGLVGQALVSYGTRVDPGSVPAMGLWAMLGEYTFLSVSLLPLLFLLYPDGHPPSPRWRWAGRVLAIGLLIAWPSYILQAGPLNNFVDQGILYQNPLGIEGADFLGTLIALGVVLVMGASIACVIALIGRFRRSVGEERQKLRWLAFVGGLAASLLALDIVMSIVGGLIFGGEGDAPYFNILWIATFVSLFLGIPAAYLIAIFRYGLWNLDVVVRKAVVYGSLVAVFLILGGAMVLLIGRTIVGVPSGTQWALLVTGLLMGLLFVPLRRASTRLADRIVYRKRATPYQVLTTFSDRVGGTYAADRVLPRMAEVLASGVGADLARVWLRLGDQLVPEASWPEGTPPPPLPLADGAMPAIAAEDAFEVRHLGEILGALSVRMPPSDPMNGSKERLVRDLAAQAGPVLRNVRLIEDLRESRRRIVAAQDERAKALERNIHDGAQQQLVALQVKLGLARRLSDSGSDDVSDLLGQLQEDSQLALENLRDLARGIYPPLLADQGLASALQAQARRSPLPTSIESDGIGRYSQDIEAAVYFCALEALQNVAKYAGASRASIRLGQTDGVLSFEVADDGRGFDPSSTGYGTGLHGMQDRLESIGGRLTIHSAPGAGTTVAGRIPVPVAT